MDVHHRARLAQVLVVHQAHRLVAQAEHLVHQGLVHQDIVRAVHQVRVVLVQAPHQVHVAQVTHHQARALVVQEVLVAHEVQVVHHQ